MSTNVNAMHSSAGSARPLRVTANKKAGKCKYREECMGNVVKTDSECGQKVLQS